MAVITIKSYIISFRRNGGFLQCDNWKTFGELHNIWWINNFILVIIVVIET